MLNYLLFILGFIFLIKGADYLVEGAASIAKKFKISNLIIGLTVVSLGTSMPELIVSTFSAMQGSSDLAMGNIVGSNISNIFLILGVSAIIYPLTVKNNTVWSELPLSILASIVLIILANDIWLDGANVALISRSDGLILLSLFSVFMAYIIHLSFNDKPIEVEEIKKMPIWKAILMFVIGSIGLALGGQWIVNGASAIAGNFGLSEGVIGLTIVAIGTSLPELAASAVAAYKKHSDIAIGNVVGSNIFNICWVLGLTAVIQPVGVIEGRNFDLFIMLAAAILLFVFMHIGKKQILHKWEGIFFLIFFFIYIFSRLFL
ncbi:calcium/sodium antiporter [Candidatus Peregrinibacteria bacterium]|nr:calcium/sodium antiporter [Candidatus Peregrinibacteria bacterium]